uniref:Uncharacterized protein n=1 Tax=Mola mola TaxID=94237 RepID=A0A3Q4APD5_MOLML
EPEDFGLGSPITGVEVAGAVKQLRSGSAPGVDEIRPELLKALDVVGLSWLTRLCNIAHKLMFVSVFLAALFSEKVRNMSPEEIRIPPDPPGRCSSQLQDKIHKLYERKLHGDFDTNSHIQKKKEFRNPSIYEKLIQFCSIDELGTNYPKDMFDPHGWSEDSYYEALAKAQKVEMDKLEKAKKERTKIEFVTGTKKGTNPSSTAASTTSNTITTTAQKRKSKWDSAIPATLAQPTINTTTATLPAVVSVTTTASGTKTTVISAVGTILKKAKQ